jgi:hypothetical protein
MTSPAKGEHVMVDPFSLLELLRNAGVSVKRIP